jgi:hypothetical protein
MDVNRGKHRLGRSGEAQHLAHDGIDPAQLLDREVRQFQLLVSANQQIQESFDRHHRVFDFMGHAGGKGSDAGQPVQAAEIEFEMLDRTLVGQGHGHSHGLAIGTRHDGGIDTKDRGRCGGMGG